MIFHLIGGLLPLLQQMQDYAGIEPARPCGHGNAVERGKAHAAIAADALFQSTEACAATEMGGDDFRFVRQPAAHLPGDEFVGEAMKAVALDALVMKRAGDGEAANEFGLRGVKSGIEGGRLGQAAASGASVRG